MRLLVVINNFPPDRGGGAAIIGDLCHSLAAHGATITVRCAYPYYPEWQDKSGQNGMRVWRYRDGEIAVERFGLYIPSNPNSITRRLVHEISFLLSLLRSLWRGRHFDAVMVYCPAVSSVAFGVLNKWLWRKPLWLNVQDLAAEAAGSTGLIRAGWLANLARRIQAWLFNQADVWSTISPVMAQRLSGLRTRKQPLLYLPNWLNDSLSKEIAALATSSRAPHIPLRLLYAGNIAGKQNLVGLLQRLRDSKIEFEFKVHGAGARADEVKQWITLQNDPRFQFGPFLNEMDFAAALSQTDYFVITEASGGGASFIPSKLMAGLGAGVPVLAVCDADSPLGTEIEQSGFGPRFSWAALDEAVDFLATTAKRQDIYLKYSKRCTERAGFFNRETIIGRFHQALQNLAAGQAVKSDY